MPKSEIELNPVGHITADAIGQPGQRVFYLQGWDENNTRSITLIIEKIQLQGLFLGITQLLSKVTPQNPEQSLPPIDYLPNRMRISPPVDPLFRVGELGIQLGREDDILIITAKEILFEGQDPEAASVVRFGCSRSQAQQLAAWSQEVINRGRPICPQCGEPMDPEGHFCPKKNGHKKK